MPQERRDAGVANAVVAVDQIYAPGSVSHGRAIAWLIGGGVYTMIVGAVLVISDVRRCGDSQRAMAQ